jgi:hypothetical protein
MIGFLSFSSLIAGAAIAAFADYRPAFEQASGFLVMGGLALAGAGLPLFR